MKKSVIGMISGVVGAIVGVIGTGKAMGTAVNQKQQLSDKHLALFLLMNQWVKVHQQGKNVSNYLEKKGFYKIAIYGMSYVGETLISELKTSNIEIAYGIDKMGKKVYADFKVVSLEEELEAIDAIVVTPITFFDEIEEELKKKIDCPIISLEDILYEI